MIAGPAKLERLGLAEQVAPGRWTSQAGHREHATRPLDPATHQDHAQRKCRGQAMSRTCQASRCMADDPADPCWAGWLPAACMTMTGSAYAVVEGVDGRPPRPLFGHRDDGDAVPGAIVEARALSGRRRPYRLSLPRDPT